MASVNPARFIHPFRFEKFIKTANTSGGSGETYDLIADARGLWEQISSDSAYGDGVHKTVTVYRVTTFWRNSLAAVVNKDTRLIYDNRAYSIDSIERVKENRQYWQFIVNEAH